MESLYYESYEYDINNSIAGDQIQKKYEILEEIYRSNQSVLNKAICKDTGYIFVLKGIRKKEGFTFEVDHIKQIESPVINKVIESYESEKFIFLIMNYVEGTNLEEFIKKYGVLDDEKLKTIAYQIALALEELHLHQGSKYVFRDLKPSNIMMKPDGTIVLIDVITIREVKENQTQDTFLIGSKGYTAPEAYGFMQTTQQSDIYSFGATYFYMLTGVQPGNIHSFKETLKERNDLLTHHKSIIYKATAFNPKDRYKDVIELKKALVYQGSRKPIYKKWMVGAIVAVIITGGTVFGYKPKLSSKEP
jgi:serine/threonine-protein kinase